MSKFGKRFDDLAPEDGAGEGGGAGGGSGSGGSGSGAGGGEGAGAGGKTVTIPESSLSRIKKEQRERGVKAAESALLEKAKAAGFSSIDEMLAAAAAARKGGGSNGGKQNGAGSGSGGSGSGTGGAGNGGGSKNDAQRLREATQRERDLWKGRLNAERQRRREAESRLSEIEVESQLRSVAVSSGVKDPDYALFLLRKEIAGKSAKDLEGFDESKWFEGLREKSPFLFGEVSRPANTGTGGGTGGAAPPAGTKPGDAAAAAAAGASVDVRKLKDEELEDYYRKRGLVRPGLG